MTKDPPFVGSLCPFEVETGEGYQVPRTVATTVV